jgi:hypothetical protein
MTESLHNKKVRGNQTRGKRFAPHGGEGETTRGFIVQYHAANERWLKSH